MTEEEKIICKQFLNDADKTHSCNEYRLLMKLLEQEPKIKVLERDEAMRRLGAVDIYSAMAWITLLNDLEYLKLKICEVEDGNDD